MSAAGRYRLLTSGGPLAALALAVLHVLAVRDSYLSWRGDTLWGLQQIGSSFVVGLPVLVVLFALPPIMRGGVQADEALLAQRPLRARAIRFGADLAPVLLVHGVAVGYVLVHTAGNGAQVVSASSLVTVALQVLAISVSAAFGRACGEVVRHPAAVMVAGLCGVLLAGFGSDALRVTAGNSSYAGLELETAGYAVAAAVLVAALALVLTRGSRPRLAAPALGAAVVGVLVAGQMLGAPTLQASGERPTRCEDADGVTVCVFDGYGFMLDDVVEPTREVLATLRAAGVDPHLRHVEQSTPGRVEARGTVSMPFDPASLARGELAPNIVQSSLLHPTWCPAINSPEPLPAAFDQDQKTAYHWLDRALGRVSDADYALAVPDFAALSSTQQRDRVQRFLDRNASCEGLG